MTGDRNDFERITVETGLTHDAEFEAWARQRWGRIIDEAVAFPVGQSADGALAKCVEGCMAKTTTVEEYLSCVSECKSILDP